jgi:glycosyltransferase involved in cell wall biosynthesis
MKLCIWMNIPSHHMGAFFHSLRDSGIDLIVCYYDNIRTKRYAYRLSIGWDEPDELSEGEQYVPMSLEALRLVPDWRDRIHIVPGYGNQFLRKLALFLSKSKIPWIHWSERARPGIYWWATYPLKKWYADLVNKHALGAFAQGRTAFDDFVAWGIDTTRISFLYYSISGPNFDETVDETCHVFLSGRPAFVFLGTLIRRKAIDILIKAFAQTKCNNHDWALLLVGNDSSNGEYRRLATKLGVANDILFREPVNASDIYGVYRSAKVAVLPSRHDGWGVPLNEAASMGLALIGSNKTGSSYHLINPGQNGFQVLAGSVDSLAHAMRAYTNNPSLADKHGKASLELYNEFTPDKNVLRVVNAVESWLSICKRNKR